MLADNLFKYLKKISFSPRKVLMFLYYFLLSCILFFLLFRKPLLNYVVQKVSSKVTNLSGDTLHIGSYGYTGINSVSFADICIYSDKDTLFRCDSLEVKIRILPLLIKKIELKKLCIDNAQLLLVKEGEYRNYDFLFNKKTDTADVSKIKISQGYNLTNMFGNLSSLLFRLIPKQLDIDSCNFIFNLDGVNSSVNITDLNIIKGIIEGNFQISEGNRVKNETSISGKIDHRRQTAEIKMGAKGTHSIYFPMLRNTFDTDILFDSISFQYQFSDDEVSELNMNYAMYGLSVSNKGISVRPVVIDSFHSDIHIHLGNNYIELDSSSVVAVNDIVFHPYLKKENTIVESFNLEKLLKSGSLEIKILPTQWNASTFFSSLPDGIFSNIRDIKAEGNLHYSLYFYLDPNHIDSLQFQSSLSADKLKIFSYGSLAVYKLNENFTHVVYEKGDTATVIHVSPDNPSFVSLAHISPYLINAVLTSEDGGFMYHRGFHQEAFRKSMAENIKSWRFVRGGSTISMQFVKNVFLTRNKTIARKIEEVIIVWLIENYRVCSKERMLEIYFNIIEWGPGIYGIADASEFYFKKKPTALNLNEAIYLASIVPKPKYYYSFFTLDGKMKTHYPEYANLIIRHLFARGQISSQDTVGFQYQVELKGRAMNYFKQDSLFFVSDTILPEIVFPDDWTKN